jgi:hypothetical protein
MTYVLFGYFITQSIVEKYAGDHHTHTVLSFSGPSLIEFWLGLFPFHNQNHQYRSWNFVSRYSNESTFLSLKKKKKKKTKTKQLENYKKKPFSHHQIPLKVRLLFFFFKKRILSVCICCPLLFCFQRDSRPSIYNMLIHFDFSVILLRYGKKK